MGAGETDLLSLAASRLGWLDDRQKILARNIANSDTPGYSPRDAAPFSSVLVDQAAMPVRTDPLHLAGTLANAGTVAVTPRQRSIDGNAVGMEEELTKVADTDTQQRLVTTLYSKYMSLYTTALGKG